VIVAPGLMVAATDSRHYTGITDKIFRFSPVRANSEDLNLPAADREFGGVRSSFRGDAKHRTMVRNCAPENLEVPRCAIAHLRFARFARAPERRRP
jgi:carboxypeptidase PM20D1